VREDESGDSEDGEDDGLPCSRDRIRAGKNLRFLEKVFRLLRFFNVRKTAQKITTQKFTKNISYTIHPFPCHVVSHVQTIA